MRASLDTNVIIHLYHAGKQEILFQRFKDGLYIYAQIRNIELVNHGQHILEELDNDIEEGRVQLFTDEKLKEMGVLKIFQGHVKENKLLYSPQDLGEIYAISLAETLGAYSLVTDDIKQGGPYMSLLQFTDNDIKPFTYADVIILNYLEGIMDEFAAIECFECINKVSDLQWSFRSQITKFINRFWRASYKNKDREWIKEFCKNCGVNAQDKMRMLLAALNS